MDLSREPVKGFLFCTTLIYVILTIVMTGLVGEFTFRHTLFLLAISLLFNLGCRLFVSEKYFYVTITLLVLTSTAYIVHFMTPGEMRIWEADTFLSFAFSVINYFLFFLAVIPFRNVKRLFSLLVTAIIFSPMAYALGHYLLTGTWLDTSAVVAFLRTDAREALIFISGHFGLSGFAFILVFALFVWYLSQVPLSVRFDDDTLSQASIVAVIFFVLNGALLFRSRDNFVTRPFIEASEIVERERAR